MASVNGSFSTGQPGFPRENLAKYGPVAGPLRRRHFETGLGERLIRLSRGPTRVRVQQPSEAGGAGDLARVRGVVHRRWFVPAGRQVVAGGV